MKFMIKPSGSSFCLPIPIIKTAEETLDKILTDKCLVRFGDGEFGIMNGSRINYQDRNPVLAERLKEVISSQEENLLVGLPDCFGSLDGYLPETVEFWRKWMFKKRAMACSYLDMNRVYYNAFFSRVYMQKPKTEVHYQNCRRYYEIVKRIWASRNVVICEGEKTRFGMCNDLLAGAKSVSRILCPSRHAILRLAVVLGALLVIAAVLVLSLRRRTTPPRPPSG